MKPYIISIIEPMFATALFAVLILGVTACFSRDAAERVIRWAKQLTPAGRLSWIVGASLVMMFLLEHDK